MTEPLSLLASFDNDDLLTTLHVVDEALLVGLSLQGVQVVVAELLDERLSITFKGEALAQLDRLLALAEGQLHDGAADPHLSRRAHAEFLRELKIAEALRAKLREALRG
jgi:hypothetical protein